MPNSRAMFVLCALSLSAAGVGLVGVFVVFPLLDALTSPLGDSRTHLYPATFLSMCALGGLASAVSYARKFNEIVYDLGPVLVFVLSAGCNLAVLSLATVQT